MESYNFLFKTKFVLGVTLVAVIANIMLFPELLNQPGIRLNGYSLFIENNVKVEVTVKEPVVKTEKELILEQKSSFGVFFLFISVGVLVCLCSVISEMKENEFILADSEDKENIINNSYCILDHSTLDYTLIKN